MIRPEILTQRRILESAKISLLGLGIVLDIIGGFITYKILLIIGAILTVIGIYLYFLVLVQEPERWIIERFGRFNRVLLPGLRYKIPLIETVRAKPRIWKQPISLFVTSREERATIQLVDGPVKPVNPVVYVQVSKAHPEKAIYSVSNWPNWVMDVTETLLLRYLQTLRIREAIDESMGLGNLFDRIKEAPDVTKRKQRKIRSQIRKLKKIIEENQLKKDVLQPLIDDLEEESARLLEAAKIHEAVLEDLRIIQKEAESKGINILSAYIDGFELPKEVEEARQKPLIAKREAEAAIYEAMTEAAKRAGPIVKAAKTLQEGGLPKEEALRKAYELEVLETLADKGIWTAGLKDVLRSGLPIVELLIEKLFNSKK